MLPFCVDILSCFIYIVFLWTGPTTSWIKARVRSEPELLYFNAGPEFTVLFQPTTCSFETYKLTVSTEKISSLSRIILTYTGLFFVVGTLILSCEKYHIARAIPRFILVSLPLWLERAFSCLLLDTRLSTRATLWTVSLVYYSYSMSGEEHMWLSAHNVKTEILPMPG